MNMCWILLNVFCASTDKTMRFWLFFPQTVDFMDYINFWILNQHWIHCREILTWSWSIILLMLFYIWLANIVLTILHLCSRERDLSPVFFSCLWSSQNEWGSIPSVSILWQNCYNPFLTHWVKFTSERTWAWCLLLWKVILINYWFCLGELGLFPPSLSSYVNFRRLYLSRDWFISSRSSHVWM